MSFINQLAGPGSLPLIPAALASFTVCAFLALKGKNYALRDSVQVVYVIQTPDKQRGLNAERGK